MSLSGPRPASRDICVFFFPVSIFFFYFQQAPLHFFYLFYVAFLYIFCFFIGFKIIFSTSSGVPRPLPLTIVEFNIFHSKLGASLRNT